MKAAFVITAITVLFISCDSTTQNQEPIKKFSIQGTWKLLSGTLIEKGDTTITDYTSNRSFIKIINDTHFAFLMHDLSKGKDSFTAFSSGGGTYLLSDSLYTEHLEYCSDREWEGNTFKFTVTINHDTLVQTGLEKIAGIGVDRINIEKYVKLKN